MKFRRKPLVVDAFQMTEESWEGPDGHPEWFENAIDEVKAFSFSEDEDAEYEDFWGIIKTLEGDHKVSWDDWIIKGVKGEIYPCKPDIFEQTYEKVE